MKKLNGLFIVLLLFTAAGTLFAAGTGEAENHTSPRIQVKILHCGG